MNELQKCLKYCKLHNGRDSCKNCGLNQSLINSFEKKIREDLKSSIEKRKWNVIIGNAAWNEKGRRKGNWELGYDDAMFDILSILESRL